MKPKHFKFAILAPFVLFGLGTLSLSAQEVHVEAVDFGAGQVFSTMFQAQRVGDLVLFKDGSVASATINNEEIDIETTDGEIVTLLKEDLTAIRFNTEENVLNARFFKADREIIDGILMSDLDIDYAIADAASIAPNQWSAILFKVKPVRVEQTHVGEDGSESVSVTETVQLDFSNIFPILTRMFASMSKFDTVILPDNQLASVMLDNRENLEITIDSVNFGRFSFGVDQVAWIEFAQEESDRDILALKDGDRVSGQIVLDGDFSGSLALGEGEFSFSEDELRTTFKQLVFQLPEGLFGGAGGGQGVFIAESDNN